MNVIWQGQGGFLTRLARDVRGATLAVMCAALIPFCGLVGGGIDMARMYITKTRLQHACDAGALAGRKQMGSGSWGTDDLNAAQKFFDANYSTGAYGTSGLTRSFSESAGKVTGTASATVNMTLMRVLGRTTETLSVTCDAEMRLPNTDIMFVLDTTGSMGSKAVATDTDTKINSLKTSVKCFYEIVAKLDTDANCTTGTPSGGTGNQVQIRFGFMPYSTNVNVGKLLPTSFLADSWTYQSREPQWNTTTSSSVSHSTSDSSPVTATQPTVTSNWVDPGNILAPGNAAYQDNSGNCPAKPASTTATSTATSDGQTTSTSSGQTATSTTPKITTNISVTTEYQWDKRTTSGIKYCVKQSRTVTTSSTSTVTHTDVATTTTVTTKSFYRWHYGPILTPISGLKNGTSWNNSVSLPIGSNGTNTSVTWDGCIEERPTVRQSSYSPIPSNAYDLDIDSPPTNANTLWGPALNGAIYLRGATTSYSQLNASDAYTTTDYANGGSYYCPAEAKKLQAWPDATAFDTYVDSLYPTGNTYHDIGMLWGARFISPNGIFSTENAYTPAGGEIDRHIIFMTDGDAQSAPCDYAAYGLPWFDQRTTTDVGTAANCPNERSAMDDQVNARLVALCTAVKNKNITLWVISFGSGSNATTEQRLSDCATPGRYFAARNSATLQQTFASIANQISQLRLTQ